MKNAKLLLATLGLCFAGCATQPPPPAPAPAAPAANLFDSFGAVLQNDGKRAVGILQSLDPAALPEKHARIRNCMLERLTRAGSAPPKPDDPFLAGVFEAYQDYWLHA